MPWFSSRPISQIELFDVDNVPPPPDARSFAINHGKAIYFHHGTPSEEPIRSFFLFLLWAVQFALLIALSHFRERSSISEQCDGNGNAKH